MKKFLVLFSLSLSMLIAAGQGILFQDDSLRRAAESILTPKDEMRLQYVPALKLTDAERDIELPARVNNAETQYMIPIFYQTGNECGQASSICYTLSYELLRRRNQHYMWGYDFAYPSRFAWNFTNRGENVGVNFMESWEVIRTAGTPTVNEWGGWYNYGELTRWISGYDIYHSAMRNRISEMNAIHIDDEEGLLTLKHWLYDHLCGDATGGLANFYCTYIGTGGLSVIPSNAYEGGKYILPAFTTTVNHAKTIVGYDDNICWDYNGDGQYTNHLDINNDGVVDIRDWERGAVIFCNTFGPDFGNDGYCYLPYCKLASRPNHGGIWNATVYVVQVKDEVFPQITYKATLRHTSRNKIKVTAGVSTQPNATVPEQTMDFYIFNYQGGDNYMQGDNTEAGKTIEFGLDVSPLLNHIEPDVEATFFLMVTEDNDPNNSYDGSIVQFSLMDYTSGSEVEQACAEHDVPMANNSTTTLSITRAIRFTKPVIQDSILPSLDAFMPYTHTLQATGGTGNLRWELSKEYEIEEFTAPFPNDNGIAVSFTNSSNGYAIVPLSFDFPFYQDTYDQLYVYADGYIAFHHRDANWPFLQNSELQANTTRMICPFRTDLKSCTLRKTEMTDGILLSFTGGVSGQSSSSLQYAVKLFKDGHIEFYYGAMSFSGVEYWSALCYGDGRTIQHTPCSQCTAAALSGRCLRMTPSYLPDGLTLSPEGILSGTCRRAIDDFTFWVTCYDNNDVKASKKLHLSCNYASQLLITDLKVNGHTQPEIFVGDTLRFTIRVKNTDTLTYPGGNLRLIADDPCLEYLDNQEYFGSIAPGNEYTLQNCITCVVRNHTPASHRLRFPFRIESDLATSTSNYTFEVLGADLMLTGYHISDYGSNLNNLLDPIELDSLLIDFRNPNSHSIPDVSFKLRTNEPDITIPIDSFHYDNIGILSQFTLPVLLYVGPQFETGSTFNILIDISIHGKKLHTHTLTIFGTPDCIDFSGGDIPPQISVDTIAPWTLDGGNSTSGGYSLRSGVIDHNGTTACSIEVSSVVPRALSFTLKTSTENNYDWLVFLIDGIEMGRWSGEKAWTSVGFPVEPGTHTLTWQYQKDLNTSTGSDCVWIDKICLPLMGNSGCTLSADSDNLFVSIGQNDFQETERTLQLRNESDCLIAYTHRIIDSDGMSAAWVTTNPGNGFLEGNDTNRVTLTFHPYAYDVADYYATLRILYDHDSISIPITMRVNSTGIATLEPENLHIHPNPTTGLLNITSTEGELGSLQLFDIYGRLLWQAECHNSSVQIDLQTYPDGVYLLQLRNRQRVLTRKIIKKQP